GRGIGRRAHGGRRGCYVRSRTRRRVVPGRAQNERGPPARWSWSALKGLGRKWHGPRKRRGGSKSGQRAHAWETRPTFIVHDTPWQCSSSITSPGGQCLACP